MALCLYLEAAGLDSLVIQTLSQGKSNHKSHYLGLSHLSSLDKAKVYALDCNDDHTG